MAVEEIKKWPANKVEILCADLFDFLSQQGHGLNQAELSQVSPFNCLAGSSIRGDSGCSELDCRAAKLAWLARYSAMYADKMFLPVPLEIPGHVEDKEILRQRLIQTVTSVLELRPLVEKGVVRPVVPVLHYCEHHAQLALRTYREGEQTVAALAAKNANKFRFSYELLSEEPSIGALKLSGPTEYIEHGSMYRLFLRPPAWAPPSMKRGKKFNLHPHTPVHLEQVRFLFSCIARDVVFHQQFGPQFDATYLTDLPGEAQFLQLLSKEDELAIKTARLFASLTHEIPLLTDLPIRTILKIRDENPQSFEAYRSTLKKIVKDHVEQSQSATEEEARDLYEDVLAPVLTQLRVEAKRQHNRWVRKSLTTAAFAVGVVSLGATGILQSAQVMALLGGATVKGLVDQLGEADTEPVNSSSLYFLLRLQDKAKHRRKGR
jgi:hypothetical protein